MAAEVLLHFGTLELSAAGDLFAPWSSRQSEELTVRVRIPPEYKEVGQSGLPDGLFSNQKSQFG
jgi:hypothetical protein